ncbi:hypothetical protein [Actinoplanes sp. RD1]|uniref:hypothetical protein n=1 Tax=Actinoplanes sp. RD1 TaxID=3064538 RepID=UPI002740368F|nr:hypothetical protein [Actinoplanes sp. RD1]
MPSASLRLIAVAVGLLVVTTGCSELDEPAAAGLTRSDLMTDLAGQLAGSAARTYEATYQLAGGGTATVTQAQEPARTMYVYPAGQALVTADTVTECRTRARPTTCSITTTSTGTPPSSPTPPPSGPAPSAPAPSAADLSASGASGAPATPGVSGASGVPSSLGFSGASGVPASLGAPATSVVPAASAAAAQRAAQAQRVPAAEAAGLITTGTVQLLLTRAGLESDVQITQHDTTIAGRHATCVELTGLELTAAGVAQEAVPPATTGAAPRNATATDGYEACVTNEGVLGSFRGVVGGTEIEIAMTHYAEHLSAGAFDLPANATITDHRPGA